jgi:hypothetical protein
MPVGRRSSVCTRPFCCSLRRSCSPPPPSNGTLSGTTIAARPSIFKTGEVSDEIGDRRDSCRLSCVEPMAVREHAIQRAVIGCLVA